MSESFDAINPFPPEPTAWEALGLVDKFPSLGPASSVGAKALEVYDDFCAANTEYDRLCQSTRQEGEDAELRGIKLEYGLRRALHSRMRYETLKMVHFGIHLRLQPTKNNTGRVRYEETIDKVCEAETQAILKQGSHISEAASLDLIRLVEESRSLYHTDPDCLVFTGSGTMA
jgi:hypothetical protein